MMFGALLIVSAFQSLPTLRVKAFYELLNRPEGCSLNFVCTTQRETSRGSMQWQRPASLDVHVRSSRFDFQYVTSPNGSIEVEHTTRSYLENLKPDRFYAPSGEFSDGNNSIPMVMLSNSMGDLLNGSVSYTAVGKETVAGVVCDHIKMRALASAEGWFAPDGRLMKFSILIPGGDGTVEFKYTFSDWGKAKSAYSTKIPPGYTPVALPREVWPLPAGAQFPSSGWQLTEGAPAELRFEQPTICAFLSTDCPASANLLSVLGPLSQKHPMAVFCAEGRKGKGWDALRAKFYSSGDGKTLDRVVAPGTPLIYAVDRKGVIMSLWFGFDPEKGKALAAEIEEALKGERD